MATTADNLQVAIKQLYNEKVFFKRQISCSIKYVLTSTTQLTWRSTIIKSTQ